MPPIAKETEVLTTKQGTTTATLPSTSTPTESLPGRPQPVALEVPVTVNGARAVEGSEKREPFSETTKTVLVFSNGAVIRLASTVTPGQLLFLTNEKTKKEVVCQVVKSKNYRNVSGYVEMEFTEPVVGFWGMRFPNDRIGPAPVAPVPVAAKPLQPQVAEVKPAERKPAEVSVTPPEAPVSLKPLVAKPEAPVIRIPVTPIAAASNAPRVSDVQPAPAKPQSVQTQAPAPRNPEPAGDSTEALRLETARLQEQLSSMLFSGAPAAQTVHEQPAKLIANKRTASDVTSKVFEFGENPPAPAREVPPARSVPPAPRPSLDEESVKIPAWLEPLARNTIAPISTQELIEREKARRAAEKSELSEPEVATVAITEVESAPEVKLPSFGSELFMDEKTSSEGKVSRGSSKAIWIGAVAAGLILLAGGGVWYMRQQAGNLKSSVSAASAPAAAVTANVLRSQPAVVPQTAPANHLAAAPPATATSAPAVNSQLATTRDAAASAGTTNTTVVPKSAPPVPVQEPLQLQQLSQQKKPILGEVHLASPKANRRASSEISGAAEPGLALTGEQITPGGDAAGGNLLAGSVTQPAAPAGPITVGGNVKLAKMISSVPPLYPALARTQHVSGDVKIDALIEVNGRVTSMNVISGPTLLHQAAKDALRQWKYQPATLDGNPVPMHLTITLQFRLQ